jgi:hypothetical protein
VCVFFLILFLSFFFFILIIIIIINIEGAGGENPGVCALPLGRRTDGSHGRLYRHEGPSSFSSSSSSSLFLFIYFIYLFTSLLLYEMVNLLINE